MAGKIQANQVVKAAGEKTMPPVAVGNCAGANRQNSWPVQVAVQTEAVCQTVQSRAVCAQGSCRQEQAWQVRSLKPVEAEEAWGLYEALGRDGAWALEKKMCPLDVLAGGRHVIGAYSRAGRLDAVCAVVDCRSALPQARAMALALRGLCGQRGAAGRQALPAAWRQGKAGCAALAALVRALAAQEVPMALAVKPCLGDSGVLAAALGGEMALRYIRPLCSLRPHYLLAPMGKNVQFSADCRIMLVQNNIYALGRYLEDGWWGIGCAGGEVELMRPVSQEKRDYE